MEPRPEGAPEPDIAALGFWRDALACLEGKGREGEGG